MSEKISSTEELYKDYSDEQLQKLLISLITQNVDSDGDAGLQNPVAFDIQAELERRQSESASK